MENLKITDSDSRDFIGQPDDAVLKTLAEKTSHAKQEEMKKVADQGMRRRRGLIITPDEIEKMKEQIISDSVDKLVGQK